MNGEDFYELYKDCLNNVGSRWGDKKQVEVYMSDGIITFKYENRVAGFVLNEKKPAKKPQTP